MGNDNVGRRDLLRGLSAGALSLGAVGALGNCSQGSGDRGAGSRGAGSKAPGRAVTVRFAMSGKATLADVADPALSSSQHDGRLMAAAYEQLTGYDGSLRATPWLAESWEHNSKATEWRFKLRRGVAFHDGHRLTSKDVVHTFRRLLDPDTESPAKSLLLGLDPDGITAAGDHTVVFRLRKPNGDLPLGLITKHSYIVPEGATTAELRRAAVGTGPFRLSGFTPGHERTLFLKHAKYWRPGLPKSDAFQLVSVPESATRAAALVRGQIDVAENVPSTELGRLRRGGAKVQTRRKGDMEMIALQTDVAPFDDNRVRLALKYAMDRREMIELVTHGKGSPVNDMPVSSTVQYGLRSEARRRDVARARRLLSEAGHGHGLTVRLGVSDVQARFMEFATVYQAQAAEAGIDVQLDVSPAHSYWTDVWLKVPMSVTAWVARPAEAMLATLFLADSPSNETHWRRPDWERRFGEARASLDPARRNAGFRELQQEVVEEGGYLSPYMASSVSAARGGVAGWQPSGTFLEDFSTIEVGR